ncbi:MAG: hypothetical protein AUJ96_17125 [Armatimonadetes bacterium CG2_30_66_41]|nr:MAG: hypothetical protein AUJ96_17125 [Armatimonadetes bacterium CG2_30_66_41]
MYDLAVVPDQTTRVYAATAEGVFRSDDGGLTWTFPANTGLGAVALRYLAATKTTPGAVFAVTNDATATVYRSLDAAASWTQVYSCSGGVYGISADRAAGAVVILSAGTKVHGSNSGGADGTWAQWKDAFPSTTYPNPAILVSRARRTAAGRVQRGLGLGTGARAVGSRNGASRRCPDGSGRRDTPGRWCGRACQAEFSLTRRRRVTESTWFGGTVRRSGADCHPGRPLAGVQMLLGGLEGELTTAAGQFARYADQERLHGLHFPTPQLLAAQNGLQDPGGLLLSD